MILKLKNRWLEISRTLDQDKQIEFLQDSQKLFNNSPSHYKPAIISCIIIIISIYFTYSKAVARIGVLSLMFFLLVNYIYYYVLLGEYIKKWERKKYQ